MPRTARASVGNVCYHVLNRGNARNEVFHKDGDYGSFLKQLNQANERVSMRLLSFCLMPNHFHLVAWPRNDGDLSRWMQWLMTSHVRRYHRHYDSSGHVWQGRFKAFPIQSDEHLLTVMRYVERNPVRAKTIPIRKAQNWSWSSAGSAESVALQQSINRGCPFGTERWQKQTAKKLGLESTMRPRGRPRKK